MKKVLLPRGLDGPGISSQSFNQVFKTLTFRNILLSNVLFDPV